MDEDENVFTNVVYIEGVEGDAIRGQVRMPRIHVVNCCLWNKSVWKHGVEILDLSEVWIVYVDCYVKKLFRREIYKVCF